MSTFKEEEEDGAGPDRYPTSEELVKYSDDEEEDNTAVNSHTTLSSCFATLIVDAYMTC